MHHRKENEARVDGDAAARRRYWTEQMDAATTFMRAAAAVPVSESYERVASLPDAARAATVDLHFSERPHATGTPRLYFLRVSLVADLLSVAEELARRGWRLVIEDGFRTVGMQRSLAQSDAVFDRVVDRTLWELDGQLPAIDFLSQRLGAMVASSPVVGTHTAASAVDVSVVDRRTGVELDRGGPYLEISEATPINSPFITAAQRHVRTTVVDLMAEFGFVAYPFEFWHFSRGDTYEAVIRRNDRLARFGPVTVDFETQAVSPLPNPERPLSERATLDRLLTAALQRRREAQRLD